MDEPVDITRTEDKAAAELERILLDAMLAMTGSLGFFAPPHVVFAKDMRQVSLLEFERGVRRALIIDQQREGDTALFDECPGKVEIAEADSGELGATSFKFGLMLAQLRDVLAAEDSTVVPQEHDHSRRLRP